MEALDVLMPAKGMAVIEDEISARLPLHRLWLEPSPALWLAEWAPRLRAIAMTGGHAPLDEAYMRQYPKLEIISSFGVGYDNIDAKAAARLGITVTNTPRVSAFGLDVVYHGRHAQADVPYRYYSSLVDMAKASDVLIVVAPGGPGTRHIINAEVLQALGPDGVLINVARGSLVDEKALIEALRNKTILAAGLDVFENEPSVPQELIALDNTVLL